MLAPPDAKNLSDPSSTHRENIEVLIAYLVDEIEVALKYQSIDVVSFNARQIFAVLANFCQDRDHRIQRLQRQICIVFRSFSPGVRCNEDQQQRSCDVSASTTSGSG